MDGHGVVVKAPPRARAGSRRRAAWDPAIIAAVTAEPRRPIEVAQELGLATHYTATRLKILMKRGDVRRIHPEGAPLNGPGASLYQAC